MAVDVVWNGRKPLQLLNSSSSPTPTTPPQMQTAHQNLNKSLSTTAASLSIVGALVIIVTFLSWPDLRTNSRKIILCISIGDLFVAVSNAVGLYFSVNHNTVCDIQATLNIAAVLSSFFWTVYLSVYIYMTICRQITIQGERRLMLFFQLTAWVIPVLIAATAYGEKAVGNSEDLVSSGWCWIKIDRNGDRWWNVLWMCIAGKGWEILSYIAISVFYFLVKWQIRREMKTGFAPGSHFLTLRSIEAVKKADRKLMFIPIVFILLRIWGTIRFFRFLVYFPSTPPLQEWLMILHFTKIYVQIDVWISCSNVTLM